MHSRSLAALALTLSLALSGALPAQVDLSETVAFGDSLTHNDLLWLLTGLPPDMYGDDPMEAAFGKGAEPGDELSSYAVAGSTSGNIGIQIDLYELFLLLGTQGRATLFHFEIGGNDILNNVALLASAPPGASPAADAVIDALIANLRRELGRLAGTPGARLVIWTIPDVTLTPELYGVLQPVEEANLRAHVERANRKVRSLERYADVTVLDLYALSQVFIPNPPVLFGRQLVPPPAAGGYDHIFADNIHPTAVSNAIVANGIIAGMNARWNDNIPLFSREELADLAHIPHP